MNRFEKQMNLPGYSSKEQEKLRNSRILVVGAGGLGCPVLLYLAAMGAGTLGIIDGDTVSLNNLNRQVLFDYSDTGKLKSEVAADVLRRKYNDVRIETFANYLTPAEALKIIPAYDIVVDCTDNFSARYMISDACALLRKPLVFGAIYKHEGQVMVFHPGITPRLHYRHVYPDPPGALEIPDCNATGVLGVLPGIIGVTMASEAMKVITGFGEALINKIQYFNLINNSTYVTDLSYNPLGDVLLPLSEKDFLTRDYSLTCTRLQTISWIDALAQVEFDVKGLLVDVREEGEEPQLISLSALALPLSEIVRSQIPELSHASLYLFCQSGMRSKKAATLLQEKFPGKKIYSIEGGVNTAPQTLYKYETH